MLSASDHNSGRMCRDSSSEPSDVTSPENKEVMEQTGYTAAVPSSYKTASDHPGTVTRLDYDSKDYVRDGAAIAKTAYVYTPYGYDENDEDTRYNIVYLMHGWGGHAGEYFEYGVPSVPPGFRRKSDAHCGRKVSHLRKVCLR